MNSSRWIYLLVFLLCAAMMVVALYMQYVEYLDPCPLCIFQRLAVISIGGIALLAVVFNPKGMIGRRIYSSLLMLASIVGAGIAGWHVYLQNLPPEEVPECGPGLDFMLRRLPLDEVLAKVFTGSGECAEVVWRFLGLSIPGWTLLFFVVFALVGRFLFVKKRA